jgi:hypothetical protein
VLLDLPAWNLQKPDSDTDPSRAPTRANQFEVPVNNLFRSGDNTLPPVLKHDTTQSLDLLFDLFTTSKQRHRLPTAANQSILFVFVVV